MNGHQFDTAVKLLDTGRTRRDTIRLLVGGMIGAGLTRGVVQDAAAACKKAGQTCAKNRDCCIGTTCKGGKCRCRGCLTNCGGKCKDLVSDNSNCGVCGNACGANQSCRLGDCCVINGGSCNESSDCCSFGAQCLAKKCVVIH